MIPNIVNWFNFYFVHISWFMHWLRVCTSCNHIVPWWQHLDPVLPCNFLKRAVLLRVISKTSNLASLCLSRGDLIKLSFDIWFKLCSGIKYLLILENNMKIRATKKPKFFPLFRNSSLSVNVIKLMCIAMCTDNPSYDYADISGFNLGLNCDFFSADESMEGSFV